MPLYDLAPAESLLFMILVLTTSIGDDTKDMQNPAIIPEL